MDPISDMFSQIKNALAIKSEKTKLPYSKLKAAILDILKKEGYISDFKEEQSDDKRFLNITLKYDLQKQPAITHIRRISKPGLRIYRSFSQIHSPLQGLGLVIVSTNQGVLTNRQARRQKIGGEIICEIY